MVVIPPYNGIANAEPRRHHRRGIKGIDGMTNGDRERIWLCPFRDVSQFEILSSPDVWRHTPAEWLIIKSRCREGECFPDVNTGWMISLGDSGGGQPHTSELLADSTPPCSAPNSVTVEGA